MNVFVQKHAFKGGWVHCRGMGLGWNFGLRGENLRKGYPQVGAFLNGSPLGGSGLEGAPPGQGISNRRCSSCNDRTVKHEVETN